MDSSSIEDPQFYFRDVKIHGTEDILSTMKLITSAGSQMDAMEFIDDYATYLKPFHDDNYKVAVDNLGYLVGYLDAEDAKEIFEFFEIGHPLLGDKPWELSPEDIFKIGIQWGEAIKEGRPFP
jgi:hypothetical protein